MIESHVSILSDPQDVGPFVSDVQRAADNDKASLGFLPEAAYKEAANQGKLLIAASQAGTAKLYAGHLLHGGAFPQARIFQTYVVPQFRQRGIGRRLVEALVRRMERLGFMSIVANVASDLTANQFWKNLSFGLVRTKAGGKSTGRQINVRLRELSTPTLFPIGMAQSQPSPQDLNLISRIFDVSPVYVLDLNVLFDLVKKRAKAEDVGRVVQAGFKNLVRLAVTDEFVRELERTSTSVAADPILQLVLRFPRLRPPDPQRLGQIIGELGALLFPVEISSNQLRSQDHSDLIHLATAIHNRAAGFVTGEKAILKARSTLQSKYSLDVLGATEFADTVDPSDSTDVGELQAIFSGQILQGRPAKEEDRSLIEAFLSGMSCPSQTIRDAAGDNPQRRRFLVTVGGKLAAFASWEVPSALHPRTRAFMCVDEDQPSIALSADFLFDKLSRESLAGCPTQIALRLLPGHVTTRRIAIATGFRPPIDEPSSSNNLGKVALGCPLTAKNWGGIRQRLKTSLQVELPDSIPAYDSIRQAITVRGPSGEEVDLTLEDLESLLSPAIFFLPGRNGAIVPIRRIFAADLIGNSKQRSLLAGPEAVCLRERVYFSDPRTSAALKVGIPILFYESARHGGSASVIAAARVVRTELVSKDTANRELHRRGVLDEKILKKMSLSRTALATTFDSIMPLRNPIGLARLRALGAIDRANLVTTRFLESERMIQIIEEGMA